MGKNEFYAWVNQAWRDAKEEQRPAESWSATRNDPAWQAMRQRRDREMGR